MIDKNEWLIEDKLEPLTLALMTKKHPLVIRFCNLEEMYKVIFLERLKLAKQSYPGQNAEKIQIDTELKTLQSMEKILRDLEAGVKNK